MELAPHGSGNQFAVQDAPYTYTPLPQGEAFRYLVLEPGGPKDALHCSIRTSKITDADYEAISYVWGTEVRDHDIICDGRLLKITKNLHDALTRLREDDPRVLWADSICINQQNVEEKTHQLAFMGRIYAEARRVVVYVGLDHGDHASRVGSLLGDMRRLFDSELSKFKVIAWDIYPYHALDDATLMDERWSSLEIFLRLPWFKRGWVVREAGLAKDCEVVWGCSKISWASLMLVCGWLHGRNVAITSLPSSYRPLIAHLDTYFDRRNEFMQVFYYEQGSSPNRLLDYLSLARNLQFRERGDCIFAFLDLATSEELHLSLNYDQHPHEVFRDFAEQYIRMTGDITILEYIVHPEQLIRNDLPTWVPSWENLDADPDPTRDDINITLRNGSSALEPAYGSFLKPKVIHGKLLKVHGAIFDIVDTLTNTFHSSTTTPQTILNLWYHVKKHPALDKCGPYSFVLAITRNRLNVSPEQWRLGSEAYIRELLHPNFEAGVLQWSSDHSYLEELHLIHRGIQMAMHGMRFMITKNGSFGLAPSAACEGDACAIIFGCVRPCLLRAVHSDSSYQFIGSAQVEYSSLESEKGHLKVISDKNESERGLWRHALFQPHDEARIRWHVEEQDIYLC